MIEKLIAAIENKNAPIVVGLDPMLKYIPEHILKESFDRFGETQEGAAEAFLLFNKKIIDAVCDLVPAVKPQSAMYEQLGTAGEKCYAETIKYAHAHGLIVIGDIKRADIGSTSEAYAVGHLGEITIGTKRYRGFDEDMATVNPYLGTDGVKPFMEVCERSDRGIFVLVKTSNPSSGEFQNRKLDSGKTLYVEVGIKVAEWGSSLMKGDYSEVGAVVGATYPEAGMKMRSLMPHTYILVPGYGAQGGKGADLVHFFNKDGLGAIVNSSRGIIAAYQNKDYASYGEENFADASRAAVIAMKDDINEALGRKMI